MYYYIVILLLKLICTSTSIILVQLWTKFSLRHIMLPRVLTLSDSLGKNNRPYAYVNHGRERMVKSNFEKRNLHFDNKPEEKEGKEEKENNFIAEEELGSCIFENEIQHKLSSRFLKFGVNVEVLSKSVPR